METLNLPDESSTLRAHLTLTGFSGGLDSKESAHKWETCVLSLVPEITWRMEQQATPIFLPEKSHGQRSLVGYRPWRAKKSEPFSKHSTLAVRALTHEFEEYTFSP